MNFRHFTSGIDKQRQYKKTKRHKERKSTELENKERQLAEFWEDSHPLDLRAAFSIAPITIQNEMDTSNGLETTEPDVRWESAQLLEFWENSKTRGYKGSLASIDTLNLNANYPRWARNRMKWAYTAPDHNDRVKSNENNPSMLEYCQTIAIECRMKEEKGNGGDTHLWSYDIENKFGKWVYDKTKVRFYLLCDILFDKLSNEMMTELQIPYDICACIIDYLSLISLSYLNIKNEECDINYFKILENQVFGMFNMSDDIETLIQQLFNHENLSTHWKIPKTFFKKSLKYRKRPMEYHERRIQSQWTQVKHVNSKESISRSQFHICDIDDYFAQTKIAAGDNETIKFELGSKFMLFMETQFTLEDNLVQLFWDAQRQFPGHYINLGNPVFTPPILYKCNINPFVFMQFEFAPYDANTWTSDYQCSESINYGCEYRSIQCTSISQEF